MKTTFTLTVKRAALLCSLGLLSLCCFALAGEANSAAKVETRNRIEIKDFAFNPSTLTVKAGEKVTWVNRDDEPHTVVSVEKQFKKSQALDTDDEFTIVAGAPGTYSYFCSVHPRMTGTIIVEK